MVFILRASYFLQLKLNQLNSECASIQNMILLNDKNCLFMLKSSDMVCSLEPDSNKSQNFSG